MNTERHFRILELSVTLSGPKEIIDPIAFAYRRFRALEPSDDSDDRLTLEVLSSREMAVDGRSKSLVGETEVVQQVYAMFMKTLLERIESHAVLHSAALLDSKGKAFLLAGPSGHGKTSLTLGLLCRGCGFLGDDYAPLRLSTRRVSPFPRTVGILPDGSAPIPEAFREAAGRGDARWLQGKALVDVGQVVGEATVAREPAELGSVILLGGANGSDPLGESRIEIGCRRESAPAIESEMRSIEGIELLNRNDGEELVVWRCRLEHALHPTLKISRLLDREAILFSQKYWDRTPDFESDPSAVRIKRREAAEYLGRELLNRGGAGRLMQRYGDSTVDLFLDLASALSGSVCWKVSVGRYGETLDLIERLL